MRLFIRSYRDDTDEKASLTKDDLSFIATEYHNTDVLIAFFIAVVRINIDISKDNLLRCQGMFS